MSDLIERANAAIGGGALNSNLIGALRDEIERLTARLIAESGEVEDLVNRLQESEDDNGRLMKRIAKLEAVREVTDYIVNHMTIDRVYGDSQVFKEARKALANIGELK